MIHITKKTWKISTDTTEDGGPSYWENLEKDLKPRTEIKKKGPMLVRKLLKKKTKGSD